MNAKQIVAISLSGFTVNERGLLPRSTHAISYQDWCDFGRRLYVNYTALRWAIGDWLNYGEMHYGEKHAQAMELFGEHAYQTIANYKYVAGRVEFSRRRENLSWSHHAEVAPLAPKEQTAWLERAEKKQWTKAELTDKLKEAGLKPTPPTPPFAETLRAIGAAIEDAEHHQQAGAVIDLLESAREDIAASLERLGDKIIYTRENIVNA